VRLRVYKVNDSRPDALVEVVSSAVMFPSLRSNPTVSPIDMAIAKYSTVLRRLGYLDSGRETALARAHRNGACTDCRLCDCSALSYPRGVELTVVDYAIHRNIVHERHRSYQPDCVMCDLVSEGVFEPTMAMRFSAGSAGATASSSSSLSDASTTAPVAHVLQPKQLYSFSDPTSH